jgi:hypothetical protein
MRRLALPFALLCCLALSTTASAQAGKAAAAPKKDVAPAVATTPAPCQRQ